MEQEPTVLQREDENRAALPRRLYIEPTSLCNLNCVMCFRKGWIDETTGHMPAATFARVLDSAAEIGSLEEIFFGGMGEPLFHPRIADMVRACSGIAGTALVTNGTLLSPQAAEALVSAGVGTVWVSMDGFDSENLEKIQQGSRFSRLLANIGAYNDARRGTRAKLGVTFVVSKDNIAQLGAIDDFADQYGVDCLNISLAIPNRPTPRPDSLFDRDDIPCGKMHRVREGGRPHGKYVCPFVADGSVFVRWDGGIAPCMQLLHECETYLFEEKRRISRASFGNINDMTLLEAWRRADYALFRQRVSAFDFPSCDMCLGCEDRKENKRDCFLAGGPTCGACLWASGKVFCP